MRRNEERKQGIPLDQQVPAPERTKYRSQSITSRSDARRCEYKIPERRQQKSYWTTKQHHHEPKGGRGKGGRATAGEQHNTSTQTEGGKEEQKRQKGHRRTMTEPPAGQSATRKGTRAKVPARQSGIAWGVSCCCGVCEFSRRWPALF